MQYTVLYTQEPEGGYTVEVVELPGCVSYGRTVEQAESMIKEAIQAYLESLNKEEKTNFLQKKTFSKQILVNDMI